MDLNPWCIQVSLANPALSIPALDAHEGRTAHSSLIFSICSSPRCDNSICSASFRMNYGWTLQPSECGGDISFISAPARVTRSVWIWERLREKNQGNLQSIKAKEMPVLILSDGRPRIHLSALKALAELHQRGPGRDFTDKQNFKVSSCLSEVKCKICSARSNKQKLVFKNPLRYTRNTEI